jgi:hypothetical protein
MLLHIYYFITLAIGVDEIYMSCYSICNQLKLFFLLDLMIRNRKVSIEIQFKLRTSIKLV